MSDISSFLPRILREARQVRSVANLSCENAQGLVAVAPEAGVKIDVKRYPLARASAVLAHLREGRLQGAAVLIP
jgi:alcohol dehydrogenase, propanol-preferring